MLLRFALQTIATALALGLVTWLLPGVQAVSVGVVIFCGLAVGIANAAVRPLLRFAVHPDTVAYVVLMVVLVNTFAVLLGPSFTQVWRFDSFAAGAAVVAFVSLVSVFVAVVPLTHADRHLAWGLNERKTPGGGPIDERPQLEEEPTAY